MNPILSEEVLQASCLIKWGLNDDGEQEYCGTTEQFIKARELQEEEDNKQPDQF